MITVQGLPAVAVVVGQPQPSSNSLSVQGNGVSTPATGPQGPMGASAVNYDLVLFFEGQYTAGELLYFATLPRQCTLTQSMSGSSIAAPDGSTAAENATLAIKRTQFSQGGEVIDTICEAVLAAGAKSGTFTINADIVFEAGDEISVYAPAETDATLGNVALTLVMPISNPQTVPGSGGTGEEGPAGQDGAAGPAGPRGTNPAFINFKASNTANLTAMVPSALTGAARFQLTVFGDSYPAGYMANRGQALIGARQWAWPAAFAKQLRARGANARADWAVGDAGTVTLGYGDAIAPVLAYDPRLSVTGTTKLLAGFNGLGGSMWWLQNPGDTLTFTPEFAFNELDLIDADSTVDVGEGTFAISFDGGATHAFTQDHNSILGPKKYTFDAPSGTAAVTVVSVSGNTFISAIGTRDTANDGLEVINTGIAGGELAVIAQAPTTAGDGATWNTLATLPQLLDGSAKHVSTLNGWFNDMNAGRPIGDVQDSMVTMIEALKPYGDVIYMTYAPLSPDVIAQDTYDQWTDAMLATCAAQDIPVIDLRQFLAPYAAMADLIYGDPIHLDKIGQALVAALVLELATVRTA